VTGKESAGLDLYRIASFHGCQELVELHPLMSFNLISSCLTLFFQLLIIFFQLQLIPSISLFLNNN
jgi:hypothetical protein